MKIKKIISLILASFILLILITPSVHAQIIAGSNGFYQSILPGTKFEKPKDGRNLRDYVFHDQDFEYNHVADPNLNETFKNAKITANMMWYNSHIDFSSRDFIKINKVDSSYFFVVVDNFYYDPDEKNKFGFPILSYNDNLVYAYLYWDIDEYQNHCLFLKYDHQKGKPRKLRDTCNAKFADRDPFIIFFQVNITEEGVWGYPVNSGYFNNYLSHGKNVSENSNISIKYAVTQEIISEEQIGIAYSGDNINIIFHEFNEGYSGISNLNSQVGFNLGEYIFYNSIAKQNFLRIGNQRAFKPYSYVFDEYFLDFAKKASENPTDNIPPNGRVCDGSNNCITSFGNKINSNFLDYFAVGVAKQFYGKPTITVDPTYIGTGALNIPEYNNKVCEGAGLFNIGCHLNNISHGIFSGIKNIGDGVKNTLSPILSPIGKFLLSIYDMLKVIYDGFWDGVGRFLQLIGKMIVGFLQSFIEGLKIIWEEISSVLLIIKTLLHAMISDVSFNAVFSQNDHLSCSENGNYSYSGALQIDGLSEKAKSLQAIIPILQTFSIALPFIPKNGEIICTFAGYKQIEYKQNSPIDHMLVMIFSFGTFFLFIKLRGND